MRYAGHSITTTGLSVLGAAALIGLTTGCGDDEPEVETVHPDTAETAWPEDEEADGGEETPDDEAMAGEAEGETEGEEAETEADAQGDTLPTQDVEHIDDILCDLLSAEEIEASTGYGPFTEGEMNEEEANLPICYWGDQEDENRGVSVYGVSGTADAAEEYFEGLASGESVEIEGADEASVDAYERDMVLIRIQDEVFRVDTFGMDNMEEDNYIALAETLISNHGS